MVKSSRYCCLFFIFAFCFSGKTARSDNIVERPIVLLITSYNNSLWYKKNLDSAFSQKYTNFRIIYVDDCSPDGTGQLVQDYIEEMGWEDRVTLVRNEERKLKMYNFYHAVHNYCNDEEIVVDFDGDDWYPHENVLTIINKAYVDPEIWMTYGTYETWPEPKFCACKKVPEEIVENNAYRTFTWVTSQQRTFYAWLFKKIDPSYLQCDGKFVDTTADVAYMFPMLEMAGGRFKYITDVIYIYNRENPISDDKTNLFRQLFLDGYIRGMKPYERLKYSEI